MRYWAEKTEAQDDEMFQAMRETKHFYDRLEPMAGSDCGQHCLPGGKEELVQRRILFYIVCRLPGQI